MIDTVVKHLFCPYLTGRRREDNFKIRMERTHKNYCFYLFSYTEDYPLKSFLKPKKVSLGLGIRLFLNSGQSRLVFLLNCIYTEECKSKPIIFSFI